MSRMGMRGRNKGKRKNLFILKYLLLISLGLGIVLFYVWERVELLEAGYKIKEREEKKGNLIEKKEGLLLSAARLKSPQRLEKIGREEMGLIVPQSIRTVYSNRKLKTTESTETKKPGMDTDKNN